MGQEICYDTFNIVVVEVVVVLLLNIILITVIIFIIILYRNHHHHAYPFSSPIFHYLHPRHYPPALRDSHHCRLFLLFLFLIIKYAHCNLGVSLYFSIVELLKLKHYQTITS